MNRKYKGELYLGLFQLVILLFFEINCLVHEISCVVGIKLFFYQLFVWFGVGYVVVKAFRIKYKTLTEVIALSYAFGAIVAVVLYFGFMLPKWGSVLKYVSIIEILLIIYVCYRLIKKNHDVLCQIEVTGMRTCLVFLLVFLFLTTIVVSFVNTMPNETLGGTGYFPDWLYWTGNNIAFTKNFPSDSFRQIGSPYKYHYFSSILIAHISLCTGVDINQISFYFSSIFAGIIFVYAAYYLATRIIKNKWSTVVFMIIVLFTDGISVLYLGGIPMTFAWHTSICPFGFDYGYSYGMLSVAFLVEMLVHDRFRELFIPSCLFLAMATGCKGPVGAIVLVAYGVVAISYLLTKRIWRGIISGSAWLTSFSVVFFAFVKGEGTFQKAKGIRFIEGCNLDSIITNSRKIKYIYKSLVDNYTIQGDRFLVKLYAVWLYIFRTNHVVVILLLLATLFMIGGLFKKRPSILLISLVVSSWTGLLLSIFMTQSGTSEMYFMMAMFPMAALAGMYSLERIQKKATNKPRIKSIYQGLCVLMLCMLGVSISHYYLPVHYKLQIGMNTIRDRCTYENYADYYADRIDYEAFEWLKKNTKINTIFAMDSAVDMYGRRNCMVAGVFSQRFMWNEKEYCNEIESKRRNSIIAEISTNTDWAIREMKKEGVEYLLEQKVDDKKEYGQLTTLLTEKYRNSHYIIYALGD